MSCWQLIWSRQSPSMRCGGSLGLASLTPRPGRRGGAGGWGRAAACAGELLAPSERRLLHEIGLGPGMAVHLQLHPLCTAGSLRRASVGVPLLQELLFVADAPPAIAMMAYLELSNAQPAVRSWKLYLADSRMLRILDTAAGRPSSHCGAVLARQKSKTCTAPAPRLMPAHTPPCVRFGQCLVPADLAGLRIFVVCYTPLDSSAVLQLTNQPIN